MKHTQPRSACPINFSLEMFGDKWSLLILRDIIYFGKKTYGEFLASDEAIARNILADRLTRLQDKGLIKKIPHPKDRRKDNYVLTEPGLDVIPILFDMAAWGSAHYSETNAPKDWLDIVQHHREEIIQLTRNTIKQGGSIFSDEGSISI